MKRPGWLARSPSSAAPAPVPGPPPPAIRSGAWVEALGVDSLAILDIGANPLTPPPYHALVGVPGITLVGFEPLRAAYDDLVANAQEHERYVNAAVGDGSTATLYEYNYSGFTSTFPISKTTLDYLNHWKWGVELKATHEMVTTRLDDIDDLPRIDLLKIDIQGGELGVFRNGARVLAGASCVITEVSFIDLYGGGAPTFADVHAELVRQGFLLHKFLHTISLPLRPRMPLEEAPPLPGTQLVDGDAVYIRDPRTLDPADVRTRSMLALMAATVFDSPGLALRLVEELVALGAVNASFLADYLAMLKA